MKNKELLLKPTGVGKGGMRYAPGDQLSLLMTNLMQRKSMVHGDFEALKELGKELGFKFIIKIKEIEL